MPYARPPTPSPDTPALDLPPLKLRSKHRRTRSATTSFTEERGPGAFVPLAHLPRRRSQTGDRKALFHFKDEQESDSSDENQAPPPAMNALGLTVDTKNLPPNTMLELPEQQQKGTSILPFPMRGSPMPSPQPPSPSSPMSASCLPRTPSTPIILSNGKPLKPSLKSSHSSPHVPGLRLHMRVQSEPATPAGGPPKNVHFAGDDALRSVRLFNSSGKPANVSRTGPLADETETETEYDSSNNAAAEKNTAGYPFPITGATEPSATQQHQNQHDFAFELDPATSASIPAANPPEYANVHFETLVLPNSLPPMLRGSIIVRNIAFMKDVAVRFTLDDWQTTSEVACKHVVSLPSLPQPFPMPTTHGDRAALAGPTNTWDRFSFVIRLEDFERKLHEKTMFMVVRYTAPGVGEWWDNNSGKDYRVGFKKASLGATSGTKRAHAAASSDAASLSPVMGNSQQRSFSAPSTLKGTPTTEAVQAIAHATKAALPKLTMPMPNARTHRASMPARPSPPVRHNSSPQPMTLSSMSNGRSVATSPYASVPTKLNLLNYAAPVRSPVASLAGPGGQFVGLSDASPSSGSSLSSSSPFSPVQQMGMINGMPATAPRYDYAWQQSNNSSTQSLNDSSPPPSYSFLPTPSETEKQRAKEIVSSPTSSLATDSSYAAFVKQWCFVQSPTPSPSVQSPDPVPGVTNSGIVARQAPSLAASAWRGIGMESFNGLYGSGMRGDSPMLAS